MKTQNDYPVYEVKYLTEEVLDAFGLYFSIAEETQDMQLLKDFLSRNNLYLSIDDVVNLDSAPLYEYPELKILRKIQTALCDDFYVVKTPKQVIIFQGIDELKFEDDYLVQYNTKFGWQHVTFNCIFKDSKIIYKKRTIKFSTDTETSYYSYEDDFCTELRCTNIRNNFSVQKYKGEICISAFSNRNKWRYKFNKFQQVIASDNTSNVPYPYHVPYGQRAENCVLDTFGNVVSTKNAKFNCIYKSNQNSTYLSEIQKIGIFNNLSYFKFKEK